MLLFAGLAGVAWLAARLDWSAGSLAEAQTAAARGTADGPTRLGPGVRLLPPSRAGKVPSNTPAHVGNLWVTVTPRPGLDVGIDGRWVSRRFADNANTIWDGGYSLFGAFASYRLHDRATLTARVRNLGDTVYSRWLTGAPMFFLGAPRTAEVALKVGL